jgi:hypothetical protein
MEVRAAAMSDGVIGSRGVGLDVGDSAAHGHHLRVPTVPGARVSESGVRNGVEHDGRQELRGGRGDQRRLTGARVGQNVIA